VALIACLVYPLPGDLLLPWTCRPNGARRTSVDELCITSCSPSVCRLSVLAGVDGPIIMHHVTTNKAMTHAHSLLLDKRKLRLELSRPASNDSREISWDFGRPAREIARTLRYAVTSSPALGEITSRKSGNSGHHLTTGSRSCWWRHGSRDQWLHRRDSVTSRGLQQAVCLFVFVGRRCVSAPTESSVKCEFTAEQSGWRYWSLRERRERSGGSVWTRNLDADRRT